MPELKSVCERWLNARVEQLVVGVYVDDLFVLASHTDDHSLYSSFTSELERRWNVENEGAVSDLLNVEVSQEGDRVILRQRAYIDKLVDAFLPDRDLPNFPCQL